MFFTISSQVPLGHELQLGRRTLPTSEVDSVSYTSCQLETKGVSCVECSSRRSTRSAALGDVSSLGMVSVDNFPSDELQASFLLIVSSQVMAGTASCDFELEESTSINSGCLFSWPSALGTSDYGLV